MSVLLVGVVAWLVLAVFVCALGRAAQAGDQHEFERARALAALGTAADRGCPDSSGGEPSLVRRAETGVHRELLEARRALERVESRLALLEARETGAA